MEAGCGACRLCTSGDLEGFFMTWGLTLGGSFGFSATGGGCLYPVTPPGGTTGGTEIDDVIDDVIDEVIDDVFSDEVSDDVIDDDIRG